MQNVQDLWNNSVKTVEAETCNLLLQRMYTACKRCLTKMAVATENNVGVARFITSHLWTSKWRSNSTSNKSFLSSRQTQTLYESSSQQLIWNSSYLSIFAVVIFYVFFSSKHQRSFDVLCNTTDEPTFRYDLRPSARIQSIFPATLIIVTSATLLMGRRAVVKLAVGNALRYPNRLSITPHQ